MNLSVSEALVNTDTFFVRIIFLSHSLKVLYQCCWDIRNNVDKKLAANPIVIIEPISLYYVTLCITDI